MNRRTIGFTCVILLAFFTLACNVAGSDRYETAVVISENGFPDGAPVVVIATGTNWPDALGGNALAGTVEGPLLLTRPTAMPENVAAEIERLQSHTAYILGGAAAVSPNIENELRARLGDDRVIRLAGADRYETAQIVADKVIELAGPEYDGGAIVATGGNYPDALSGSPLAAARSWPILLARPATNSLYVPEETTATIILGGTGAVSAEVEGTLRADLGESQVIRIGGENRYATAAAVANHSVTIGFSFKELGVATGENFPDALCAGPVLGPRGAPLLLTRSTVLSMETRQVLEENATEIEEVAIFGGTGAISQNVRDAINGIVQ